MARPRLLLFFVLFLALTWLKIPAQTPALATTASTVSAPVMPKDPAKLMQLATKVNGLDSPDIKPWHLKATYQTFDDEGKPKDQGTFEEWWAGHTKYKLSYASAGFNQVQYQNGADTRITGDGRWPPSPELWIAPTLLNPLMSPEAARASRFSADKVKLGNIELKCLRLVPQSSPSTVSIPSSLPAFCFGEDIPALRLEASFGNRQTIYNSIVAVAGQYVAKQIRLTQQGHPLLNVDVVSLDLLDGISDAELMPPADASLAPPRKIRVSAGVLQGIRLSGDPPRYPDDAKQNRVQGTVVIHLVVTEAGEPTDLQIVSGPPMLQQSALDCIRTWRYKPYLLNGIPVEVESQVNVIYTLSR
jgi:TonB family protein